MSIASEITRIQTAKENIKTSIINKGGTLASNALLSDYATAISSIPTSGGTGQWTTEGLAEGSEPTGNINISLTEIPLGAFSSKYNITSLSAPNATIIRDQAFRGCTNLETIYLPEATRFYDYVFADCPSIESVILPEIIQMGKYCFYNNTSLQEIHMPKVTGIPQSVLQGCSSLTFLYFPHQKTTGTSTFANCSNLETLILPSLTSYGGNSVFANCSKLTTVVFGLSTALVRNENISCWNNTPFAQGGTGGEIYIPKALYDHLGDGSSLDYQAATNWSTMIPWGTITWKQIEGSEYEPYMIDGEKYNEEMALLPTST